MHVVFQVTRVDICKYHWGVLLRVVISIGFIYITLGFEHFADLHSHGKIVKLLNGYHSSLNRKILRNSK